MNCSGKIARLAEMDDLGACRWWNCSAPEGKGAVMAFQELLHVR